MGGDVSKLVVVASGTIHIEEVVSLYLGLYTYIAFYRVIFDKSRSSIFSAKFFPQCWKCDIRSISLLVRESENELRSRAIILLFIGSFTTQWLTKLFELILWFLVHHYKLIIFCNINIYWDFNFIKHRFIVIWS